MLLKLTKLTKLCGIMGTGTLLTDVGVGCVVTQCTRLQHISLRRCSNITDSALVSMSLSR